MKPSIYLAGPITDCALTETFDWREYVSKQLADDIICFSPLRAKPWLRYEQSIRPSYEEHLLSSQRGIYMRDMNDCRSRDLIFVNLQYASKASIGTVMEIAWATAFNKPLVLVMEDTNNVHDHPMIREACPMRVNNVDDGIAIARAILLP